MKILIYPEGAICWSRPKNFRAEVGIGPTEQMCSARLLGFLNSCSGGRSCLCLYLPTSGRLAKLPEQKRKLHQASESWGGTVTVKQQSSLGIYITYSSYQPTLVKGEDLEAEGS